jgi:hypothetical protein
MPPSAHLIAGQHALQFLAPQQLVLQGLKLARCASLRGAPHRVSNLAAREHGQPTYSSILLRHPSQVLGPCNLLMHKLAALYHWH